MERLLLEWRPGTPVPPPNGRLLFRRIRHTEELLGLMSHALDAHHRTDLVRMIVREEAERLFEEELAEGARVLSELDVPRIRAATDLDNVPMANAFLRAGYVNSERVLHTTWD